MDEERFQQVKEKEITRLTTPMPYPKLGGFTFKVAPRDCEGNPVPIIKGFRNRHVLEPKPGILSDDEILIYAPESKEASKIRLKRGIGTQSDKTTVNGDLIYALFISTLFLFMFGLFALLFDNLIVRSIFVLIIIIMIVSYMFMLCILKIILNHNINKL